MTIIRNDAHTNHSTAEMCFVIRSFGEESENAWELAIKPAILEAGLDPWDGQEERLGSNIIHADISRLIWESTVVVADLASLSPNVMYELGLAHAAKKPVIMLIEESIKPPFDIAHIRHIKYKNSKLSQLKVDLIDRINSTRQLGVDQIPDFFPELKILTRELSEEIVYLRSTLTRLNIRVDPYCADIFVNDKWVGYDNIEVGVNFGATRNTFSVATVGYFDFHEELLPNEQSTQVDVSLESSLTDETEFSQRVEHRLPAWLRDRRRDPENPVLMKAVSNYLLMINEKKDALHEIEQLLECAGNWHLSYVQRGFYHGVNGEIAEAIPWYEIASAMCDYHYIGVYNIACNLALLGELDRSIQYLERIVQQPKLLLSIQKCLPSLSRDADFKNLWLSPKHRNRYREIELEIFPGLDEPEKLIREGKLGYVF